MPNITYLTNSTNYKDQSTRDSLIAIGCILLVLFIVFIYEFIYEIKKNNYSNKFYFN